MVKVSVVIPVYNVEKYLRECLDSIINQTLTDLEIICVNDGSTDNSLSILEEYKKKDKRIIIISQENKGLGATRNKGLDQATGKYIYFIDSDDFLDLNALKELYELCEEKSLDFALFRLINYNEDTNNYYQEDLFDLPELAKHVKDNIFNYKELGDIIFTLNVVAVNKLYNLNFLREINARFSEGVLFEDNVFFWKVLFNAKRIVFYKKHFYTYRRRSMSITTKGNKNFVDTIKIHNWVNDIFKEYNLFEKYKAYLYNKKISLVFIRFEQIDHKYKDFFFKKMKKDWFKMVEYEGNLDKLLTILNKKNRRIITNTIESKNAEELILKYEKQKLLQKNKKLKNKNKKLNKKIKKLNKNNKKILSSKSWKITKPLRFIMNIFRN